uniref:PH domain-containing protein n=1 Tax=Peronospora matthiolae TaxID=2874970 RepID=A0AAV1TL66_9STRA
MPSIRTQPVSHQGMVSTEKVSTGGLQLLSPTFQQSIQRPALKTSSSDPVEDVGWSTTPTTTSKTNDEPLDCESLDVDTFLSNCAEGSSTLQKVPSNAVEFDFNGFTIASVRQMGQVEQHDVVQTSVLGSNSRGSRTNSIDCGVQSSTSNTTSLADYCSSYYNETAKLNPLSCSMGSARTTSTIEDFDMQRHHSFDKSMRRTSVVARSTFQLSSTAASSGFPLAKKKEVTAVVMRGWLEKRKGLVLKRWKPFYCLLKSDDSLCLYASEDTVNGRLEQRCQVLRVMLTDKNDSFHIIGVDSEGAPRREELRALVPREWARWFRVLCKFLDSSSIEHSVACKPELNLTKTSNETEEGDWSDNESNSSHMSKKQRHFQSARDGNGDDQTSMHLSFSGSSSAVSINGNNRVSEATTTPEAKADCLKLLECPMIGVEDQGVVPMLGIRASKSKRAGLPPAPSSDFSRTK